MVAQDVEKLKAAFGDQEFTGKDVARVLQFAHFSASGAAIKFMLNRGFVRQTKNGYHFRNPLDILISAPAADNEPHRCPTLTELAAETERALIEANKEIAELKSKIEAIRAMFRGDV